MPDENSEYGLGLYMVDTHHVQMKPKRRSPSPSQQVCSILHLHFQRVSDAFSPSVRDVQRNKHLQIPIVSYKPRYDGLKRKFSECSSSMEPVPEEDPESDFNDTSSDQSSICPSTSMSSTSSSDSDLDLHTPDLVEDTSMTSSSLPPLSLHHDSDRHVAMEVEHVKHLHMQDKAFFQRELRNLRMLLFEAESNLQHRTEELEFILQERDAERWEWEQKKAELEREKEREKEQLRERNKELGARLELKNKELAKVMGLLEKTQRELVGVESPEVSNGMADEPTQSVEDGSMKNPASSRRAPGLARYATIPSRVASLRKQVDDAEQRFQTAYNAWSSENKYIRQKTQQQLKSASDDVRKSKEEVRKVKEENRSLMKRVSELKENVAQLKRESQSSLSSGRRPSKEFQPPSPTAGSSIPAPQDKISIEEALKRVQKLNTRVADAAAVLAKNLAQAKSNDGTQKAADKSATREAVRLLGGEAVTSQLSFLPSPSKTKENVALQTLLQVALTNWTASHIDSWELEPSSRSSGNDASPMAAIYRKLKVVGEHYLCPYLFKITDSYLSIDRGSIRCRGMAQPGKRANSLLLLRLDSIPHFQHSQRPFIPRPHKHTTRERDGKGPAAARFVHSLCPGSLWRARGVEGSGGCYRGAGYEIRLQADEGNSFGWKSQHRATNQGARNGDRDVWAWCEVCGRHRAER